MPKQRHSIKRCRVRLRPKMAKIRRRVARDFEKRLDAYRATVVAKELEVQKAEQALIDHDKGRTLRSHVSAWWANRKAGRA